ncbi:MAG TPA: DUF3047 domain-containing protein [Azospirillaceae bacterium]|nr:DUF3047 domain-containing protein [Azospirillaceae bacterium]
MNRPAALLLPLLLALGGCGEAEEKEAPGTVRIDFEGELVGWAHRTMTERTEYEVVRDEGRRVLKAVSRDSASILTRAVHVDLRQTPILEFSWKVEEGPLGLDERTKQGNDFAARIYVALDGAPAGREDIVLNYVWSGTDPEETISTSPYWEGSRAIVATSADKRGQWVTVRRDLRQDLDRAFGFRLDIAESISIMTDTDDSDGQATAYYGTLRFLPPQ